MTLLLGLQGSMQTHNLPQTLPAPSSQILRTWLDIFSTSGPIQNQQLFLITQKMVWSRGCKCGTCCLKNPTLPCQGMCLFLSGPWYKTVGIFIGYPVIA